MRGFTLVELLIVIGITMILAAAASPIYGSLQIKAQLNETTSQVIQTLRTAREYSVARYNNSAYGVFIDITIGGNDNYILYQGDSYATRDTSYDRSIALESVMSFANIDMTQTGNDIDINFTKGSGQTDNIGSFQIVHDVVGSRDIIINKFGVIEEG